MYYIYLPKINIVLLLPSLYEFNYLNICWNYRQKNIIMFAIRLVLLQLHYEYLLPNNYLLLFAKVNNVVDASILVL